MWRFMFVTFVFLGWSFYVLSGGSDYEPVANSIQARSADRVAEPAEVMVAALDPVEQAEEEVTRSTANLSDIVTETDAIQTGERFQITLASADAGQDIMPNVVAEPASVKPSVAAIDAAVEAVLSSDPVTAEEDNGVYNQQQVFSLETYAEAVENGTLMGSANAVTAEESNDYRRVSGNLVNMRAGPGTEFQKVGKLSKNTEVVVLDEPGNGWLMLEVVGTGETGWMADWLLTASN